MRAFLDDQSLTNPGDSIASGIAAAKAAASRRSGGGRCAHRR
ncbi:MAG: hypothetical protein QM783_15035 [Phycisphaerales bacterium]